MAGAVYYYAIATHTLETGTAAAASNIAGVTVTEDVYNYISNLRIYATQSGIVSPDVPNFTFSPHTTDYRINVTDGQSLYKIDITWGNNLPENVYVKIMKSGSQVKEAAASDAKHGVTSISPATLFTGCKLDSASPLQFSIVIGIKDGGTYKQTDTYDFTVRREEALKSLLITDATDADIKYDTTPSWTVSVPETKNIHTRQYTAVVPEGTEALKITALPRTLKDTAVYIGDRKVDDPAQPHRITLGDFNVVDNKITIPINLRYEGSGAGADTEYTLTVSLFDHSPVITGQPANVNCEKDEDAELSVQVQTPESGTLSYQWRRYTSNANPVFINGATEAAYSVPTSYASTYDYDCIVKNTVNGVEYQTITDRARATVNLTYISPIVFLLQPGHGDYKKSYFCNEKPESVRFAVYAPDEGVSTVNNVSYALFYNTTASTENGVLVNDYPDTSGPYNVGDIHGFKRIFESFAQEEPGTYYYYVVAKAYAAGCEPVETVSDFLEITFSEMGDLVPLAGSGKSSDPYLITSVADLEAIRALIKDGYYLEGQHFKLTADITLPVGWEPLGEIIDPTITQTIEGKTYLNPQNGKNVAPFSGRLDGDGHTITVPENGLPLFNYVRSATVKNLNIYGVKIAGAGLVDKLFVDYGTDGEYAVGDPAMITLDKVTLQSGSSTLRSGLLQGSGSSVNDISITNCTVEEDVIVGYDRNSKAIGSFVGELNGVIKSSASYANVYGADYVGGLVGAKGQSMGDCMIYNSLFQGNVHASGRFAGGILSMGYGGCANPVPVTIRNCLVIGSISGGNAVGGVFGGESGLVCAWNESWITDNAFIGQVSADKESTIAGASGKFAGGIVGFLRSVDKAQHISNNYFHDTGGSEKNGIGYIGTIIYTDHSEYGEQWGIADEFVINDVCKPMSAAQFADGTVVKLLNGSETSYRNWCQGEKYPYLSSEPIVHSLELSGEYKTQYYIDEPLDLSGIDITAHWSDGAETKPALSDVKVSGYDSSTRGVKTVTLAYGAATAELTVTVLIRPGPDPDQNTIKVYLTLLGADARGKDYTGTPQTLKNNNLKTWIPRTAYEVDLNATVWDVLKTALDEKGWRYSNPNGNYVESITKDGVTLAELTNGGLSGWMYTLNGTHPSLGVAEQFLENEDRIVFHYTDDYTQEEGTEKWGGGTPTAASDSAALAPKVTAKNGVASATVSAADMASAIAAAKKNGGASILIAPEIAGTASKISVNMPRESLASIATETDANLVVKTAVGSLTIPNSALASIASQAKGSAVTVSLARVDNSSLTAKQQEAAGDNPVYDLNVTSGGTNISGFGGKSITVSLPYTLQEGEDPAGVTVWYLNDAGELEQIACTYDPGTGMAIFTTDHLSCYVVGYAEAAREAVTPAWANPFTDVKPADWFYNSVAFAVRNDLFSGTSATAFSPNEPMTRAMLVTVLYRLEGEPAVTGSNSFTDARSGQWYTDAVIWANAEGIVTGYGGGLFGPNDSVTRQQMAAILHNYARHKGYDVTATTDLAAFNDAAKVSDWAREAVQWANAAGLITGRTATGLAPDGTATRAEVASILMRFCEDVAG
ncbi:S-layer homology domain-containing protein [Desulfoscipio sp. XC116]|uniref:S-layer homology domain-containing protein n=1 Tax=Desulfoscipio sp. XC116 TaxID=3144975 RepID=UPI00325BCED4